MSCHDMPCPLRHVFSCRVERVMSSHAMSKLIMSSHAMSKLIMSSHAMSSHAMSNESCHVASRMDHVFSCHVECVSSSHAMSNASCPLMPRPKSSHWVFSCHVTSWNDTRLFMPYLGNHVRSCIVIPRPRSQWNHVFCISRIVVAVHATHCVPPPTVETSLR